MNTKKIIAIIGATGNVGFTLLEELHKTQEYTIIAIARNPHKKDFSKFNNIETRKITDLKKITDDELVNVLQDVEILVDCAHVTNAEKIFSTLNKAIIQHVIITSSTGIYSKVDTPGHRSRHVSENFISKQDIPWTVLRPSMIFGCTSDKLHRDNTISKLIRIFKKVPSFCPIPIIGKNNLIQPVFLEDLVSAYLQVIENPATYFKKYDIAGEIQTNLSICKLISKALNKKRYFIPIPLPLALLGVKISQLLGLKIISEGQLRRFLEDKNVDMRNINFKYKPISFEAGLKKLLD